MILWAALDLTLQYVTQMSAPGISSEIHTHFHLRNNLFRLIGYHKSLFMDILLSSITFVITVCLMKLFRGRQIKVCVCVGGGGRDTISWKITMSNSVWTQWPVFRRLAQFQDIYRHWVTWHPQTPPPSSLTFCSTSSRELACRCCASCRNGCTWLYM